MDALRVQKRHLPHQVDGPDLHIASTSNIGAECQHVRATRARSHSDSGYPITACPSGRHRVVIIALDQLPERQRNHLMRSVARPLRSEPRWGPGPSKRDHTKTNSRTGALSSKSAPMLHYHIHRTNRGQWLHLCKLKGVLARPLRPLLPLVPQLRSALGLPARCPTIVTRSTSRTRPCGPRC